MNKGDIVTVLTVAGEFIGKLNEVKGNGIVLDKPRMLVQGQEGMGFAHGVCVTGERNPEICEFGNVVLMTPTNKEVADAWITATTGIALA
jgi:hypothetical protein